MTYFRALLQSKYFRKLKNYTDILIVFLGRVLYYIFDFYYNLFKNIYKYIKTFLQYIYTKHKDIRLKLVYNGITKTKSKSKQRKMKITGKSQYKNLGAHKRHHTPRSWYYLKIVFFPFYAIYKILRWLFSWEFKVKPFSFSFIAFTIFISSLVAFAILYFSIIEQLPTVESLQTYNPKYTTNIYDRKGNLLYRTYNNEDRYYVQLEEIPDIVQKATIAVEDATFYDHFGLSFKGIVRAAKKSYLEDDLQGGSTITQQLVKNSLLSGERTYTRKIKEAILSLELERKFDKADILEMYLNKISYGGTSYGIKSAANKYFGKELSELTLAEASLLAGLPASPSNYSPLINDVSIAKARQWEVLDLMVKSFYITQEQADAAFEEELVYKAKLEQIVAPHFVNYVISELEKKYGQKMVAEGGLNVYTTIDLELQNKLQEIVTKNIAQMGKRSGVTNGAALITNPSTGEILAMVGSINYWHEENDGQVNVTTSLRQPGSSIKPITYALAFESGMHPFDTVEDSPVTYKIEGQPDYKPVNYDGGYHGKVTLKAALANSYNIPAVKVLDKLGMEKYLDFAHKIGINSFEDTSRFGLSITLGAGEVKMTDMATAYGTFPNNGYKVEASPILRIYDYYGNTVFNNDCAKLTYEEQSVIAQKAYAGPNTTGHTGINTCHPEKVISEDTAFYINEILSDNQARLPAFGAGNNLAIKGKQVAVKTGTTQNLKDNWAIGYTKEYVVLTWIGNNDGTPMKNVASGYGSASQLWRETFDYLIKNKEVSDKFSIPSDMIEVSVCPITNTLACGGCPNVKRLYKKGSEPEKACNSDTIRQILEDQERQKREDEDHDGD